jgi:hypothetical protein
MSVRLGTQFALCAGLGLIFAACGGSASEENMAPPGSGTPVVGNIPSNNAGQGSGDGFKGWGRGNAGSGGAAGTTPAAVGGSSGAAGTAAAGTAAAGSSAAGSGGAAGGAALPAAGSGAVVELDPFDIFGLGGAGAGAEPDPLDVFDLGAAGAPAISCSGLVCAELGDCQMLYPDENASCKFTRCEDFECK